MDEVFRLGDFAVGHKAPGALLDGLHGRKHLVPGNTDPDAALAMPGWAGRTCNLI